MERNIKDFDNPLIYERQIDAVEGRGWLKNTLYRSNKELLIKTDADGWYLGHRLIEAKTMQPTIPAIQKAPKYKPKPKPPTTEKKEIRRRKKTHFDKMEERIAYLYGIGYSKSYIKIGTDAKMSLIDKVVDKIVSECNQELTDEQKETIREYVLDLKKGSLDASLELGLYYHLVFDYVALWRDYKSRIANSVKVKIKEMYEAGFKKSAISKKLKITVWQITKIVDGN